MFVFSALADMTRQFHRVKWWLASAKDWFKARLLFWLLVVGDFPC